jgi:ATP-binding cassette subfamily B protein
LRTGFEKIDRIWGDVTNVLADTIPGIRVVKAFAQESRESQRFREANQHNLMVNDKLFQPIEIRRVFGTKATAKLIVEI